MNRIFLGALSASALLLCGGLHPVAAHDAPTGWTYPYSCCSGMDCRPVSAKWLKEEGGNFIIPTTGETIPYTDRRVKNSPDGEFHWCSVAGKDDGRTICLFVPPRGF